MSHGEPEVKVVRRVRLFQHVQLPLGLGRSMWRPGDDPDADAAPLGVGIGEGQQRFGALAAVLDVRGRDREHPVVLDGQRELLHELRGGDHAVAGGHEVVRREGRVAQQSGERLDESSARHSLQVALHLLQRGRHGALRQVHDGRVDRVAEDGELVVHHRRRTALTETLPVATGPAGDLFHLGGFQQTHLLTVEFAYGGEHDPLDAQVEPHADGVRGDQDVVPGAGPVVEQLSLPGASLGG